MNLTHNKLFIIEALLSRKMHPSINNQSTGINRTLKLFTYPAHLPPLVFLLIVPTILLSFLQHHWLYLQEKTVLKSILLFILLHNFFHWHWSFLLFLCVYHLFFTEIDCTWKEFFCTITLPGFTPQPLIINSPTYHEVTPILISWRWLM